MQQGILGVQHVTKNSFNLWTGITFEHLINLLLCVFSTLANVDYTNCSLFVHTHKLPNCGKMFMNLMTTTKI